MAGIATYLSMLTLNVNGVNFPNRRHHLVNWIKRKTQKSVAYKKPTLLTENLSYCERLEDLQR
jgi:hypothetical protein